MAAGGLKTGGLASRITRVTLIIGVITVVSAGAVAIVSSSRLAANQVATHDRASLEFIEDQVSGRLASVEAVASNIATALFATTDRVLLGERIGPVIEGTNGLVDKVVVCDRRGAIIATYPSNVETITVTKNVAFTEALRGATGFRRDGQAGGPLALWLTRTALGPGGSPAIILMHVNLQQLKTVLQTAGDSEERAILILESGQPLITTGLAQPPDLSTARWRPQGARGGRVDLASNGLDSLGGFYSDLQSFEGIAWRVVVLEPRRLVAGETAVAVAPSIAVLVIGGLVMVYAAWATSRRLVNPLMALETAAYRAATGAYVKPIAVMRDDEIGQVAEAFNAVTLRLNALHDLSQLLASASQLDQVLDGILSAMGHIMGPGVAAIYLLDDSGRWLVPARARGADVSKVAAIDGLGDSWIAASLRDTDTVARSGDSHCLADELPGLTDGDGVALLAPLVSGHEVLGVVVVLRDKAETISEGEREMVRTFSAQAAVAVHNSRLFAVETESRRVSEGLRAVAEQLVRPEGLEESLRRVESVITELFNAKAASFAVVDRSALGLSPLRENSPDNQLLGFAMRVLLRSGVAAPVVVGQGEDVGADAVMELSDSKELLVVPVALQSPHGAVLVVSLGQSSVGSRDFEIANAVANEIELALENAYLYERAVTRAANLETIFRISQAVGSSLQVNVVLNRVLDVVQKILAADAVALMTYDQRQRTITTAMARGAVSPDMVDLRLSPGEDVPGYVFSTGEPATFRDLHDSMGGVAGDAARHGMHSMLAVPLLARGRSIGVLIVFSVEPGVFSDEDMSVLQTFASQAALAVDTARLYSREHEVAQILQRSILPEDLPQFDEIESASVYQPAGAEAEIGGDYYDLFRSADGAIWFAIADVCGKGVTAATKTSMIKYSVRALVAAGLGPASVLTEVNRMVCEGGEASDIVTLWTGRFDPRSGLLAWSSGGHPPGLVLRCGEPEVEWLPPTGPLLGAVVDVAYGEETMSLSKGDTILLYTDGVTEARNGNVFFGEERVRDTVLAGGTAAEIVRRLLTVVRRFVRGDLRDDVAVLAISVCTSGSGGTPREGRSDT